MLACLPAPPALQIGLSPAPRPPPGSPLRHPPCPLRRRTPDRRMCPRGISMANNRCSAEGKEKDTSCREHTLPSACLNCRPLRAFPRQLTSHFPAHLPHLIQVEGPHADVGVGNDVWVKRPVTKSSRHRQTTLDAPPQHTAARSAHACDLCWAHLREGAKCGSVEMGQDAAGKGRQGGGRGPSAAPRSRRACSANNTAQHSTNTDAKIKAKHRQVSSQSCQGSAVNLKPALPVAGVCGPLTAGRACGRHLTLRHTPNSIRQYQATSNNT